MVCRGRLLSASSRELLYLGIELGEFKWSKIFTQYGSVHDTNTDPIMGLMNSRREFLSLGLASFAAMAMFKQDTTELLRINTLSTWELPAVNLNRWQTSRP